MADNVLDAEAQPTGALSFPTLLAALLCIAASTLLLVWTVQSSKTESESRDTMGSRSSKARSKAASATDTVSQPTDKAKTPAKASPATPTDQHHATESKPTSALMQEYQRWKARKANPDATIKQRVKRITKSTSDPTDDHDNDDAMFEAIRQRERLDLPDTEQGTLSSDDQGAAGSSRHAKPNHKTAVDKAAPKTAPLLPPPNRPGTLTISTNTFKTLALTWKASKPVVVSPSTSTTDLTYHVECAVVIPMEGSEGGATPTAGGNNNDNDTGTAHATNTTLESVAAMPTTTNKTTTTTTTTTTTAGASLTWVHVYSGPATRCEVPTSVLPHGCQGMVRVRAAYRDHATHSNDAASNNEESNHKTTASEWVTSDVFWRVQGVKGGSALGGFGPNKSYWWTQTLEEIDVYIPLSPPSDGSGKVKASVISHEAFPSRVSMKRRDTGEILLQGQLHDEVEPDECFWELTMENGRQVVGLNMRKKAPEFAGLGLTAPTQFWPRIIVGHPAVDEEEMKKYMPEDVIPPDGKPVRQKRPYGREAERAGWSPYGMDANADPPMEDMSGMFG